MQNDQKSTSAALASEIPELPPESVPSLEDFLPPPLLDQFRLVEMTIFDPTKSSPVDALKHYRPPFSFPLLAALALLNSRQGFLPRQEIYNFIRKNFPYFRLFSDVQ